MALQPSLAISAAEHDYIVKGVALDVRNDGRGRLTTRPFSVDTRATLVRQTRSESRTALINIDVSAQVSDHSLTRSVARLSFLWQSVSKYKRRGARVARH